MAFVNEFAPKEDLEKYGFTELQKSKRIPSGWDAWTIDRGQGVILMLVGRGHELETSNLLHFLLYRNGEVTYHWLSLDIDHSTRTLIWTLSRVTAPNYESEEEKQTFEARYTDLKDALHIYKARGCYESASNVYENVTFTNI